MRWDEREDYGEEARDAIEGLRHLAHRAETPPDLRSEVMARAERLLPLRKTRRARWWAVVAAWRPHPLAWGPVVAAAFFAAGALTPWPRAGVPLGDLASEERPAPVVQSPSTGPGEVQPASPVMPSQPSSLERQRQAEPAPSPVTPFSTMARREQRYTASSTDAEVTTTLPAALYEQLQQEAQRRRLTMAVILREAAEAYAQSPQRAH